MGNSLSSINGNFATLSSAVCDLSGSVGFGVVDSSTIDLDWNASTRTLSADVSTAVKNASAFNVFDSPTIDLNWNASTRTLSASTNGFLYVPLNDPTDPLNNNSGVQGTNVISFAATGNTSATPYTGATQTANLASIVPNDAYMVLVKIYTGSNMFSNTMEYIYVRKNTSDSWRLAGQVEPLGTNNETSQTWTMPIIFDRTSKSFQAYYNDPKPAGAPSSAPAYYMVFDVLGYFIK